MPAQTMKEIQHFGAMMHEVTNGSSILAVMRIMFVAMQREMVKVSK